MEHSSICLSLWEKGVTVCMYVCRIFWECWDDYSLKFIKIRYRITAYIFVAFINFTIWFNFAWIWVDWLIAIIFRYWTCWRVIQYSLLEVTLELLTQLTFHLVVIHLLQQEKTDRCFSLLFYYTSCKTK